VVSNGINNGLTTAGNWVQGRASWVSNAVTQGVKLQTSGKPVMFMTVGGMPIDSSPGGQAAGQFVQTITGRAAATASFGGGLLNGTTQQAIVQGVTHPSSAVRAATRAAAVNLSPQGISTAFNNFTSHPWTSGGSLAGNFVYDVATGGLRPIGTAGATGTAARIAEDAKPGKLPMLVARPHAGELFGRNVNFPINPKDRIWMAPGDWKMSGIMPDGKMLLTATTFTGMWTAKEVDPAAVLWRNQRILGELPAVIKRGYKRGPAGAAIPAAEQTGWRAVRVSGSGSSAMVMVTRKGVAEDVRLSDFLSWNLQWFQERPGAA
jgi:hypothetical protein